MELGAPACVAEDKRRFVLNRRIMRTESDADPLPGALEDTQEKYPRWQGCSFDKGFQRPRGKAALDKVLEVPVLPRKERMSKADEARESGTKFREARRKHAAGESATGNQEQRGPDRILEKSEAGFARMAALSILAANMHRMGVSVRDRQRERLKKNRMGRAA